MWFKLLAAIGALVLGIAWWVTHRVPRLQLAGKVVLITGGSTGIGLEMAKVFIKKGAFVCISARRVDVLKQADADIRAAAGLSATSERLAFVAMDVSKPDDIETAMLEVKKFSSKAAASSSASGSSSSAGGASRPVVDVLVCCAGFSHPSRFLDIPASKGQQMMEVNYFGCVNAVRAVLPSMYAANSGRIALVSSQAAVAAVSGFTLYSPTKAAVRSFAQALNMESMARGVQVQLINPPDVATPGYEDENKVKSPECKEICAMGGAAPWKAVDVATAAVAGVEKYAFQVNIGFDGWLLGSLSASMDPSASVPQLLFETVANGVLRLVISVYSKLHYGITFRHLRKEGLTRKR